MFWRYQDLENRYEEAKDDMNLKAEYWRGSIDNQNNEKIEYEASSRIVDEL